MEERLIEEIRSWYVITFTKMQFLSLQYFGMDFYLGLVARHFMIPLFINFTTLSSHQFLLCTIQYLYFNMEQKIFT